MHGPVRGSLLVAVLVLAGCTGGSGPTDDPDPPGSAAEVHGFVLDDEFRPVANASVAALVAADVVVANRSDADGAYRLPGVPIGSVTLAAQAPGFERLAKHEILLPGQSKRVDFRLQAVPRGAEPPPPTTEPFAGRYDCAADQPLDPGSCDATLQRLTGQGVFQSHANHTFTLSPDWGGLLLEVDWRVGAGADALDGIRLVLGSAEDGSVILATSAPHTPVRTSLNNTAEEAAPGQRAPVPAEGGPLWVRIEPQGHPHGVCIPEDPCPGLGAAVELEYTLWVTTFYTVPVDPAFSAIEA